MAGNGTENTTIADLECRLFPDTPYYCDILVYTRAISGSLSLIGSSFVLSIIWLFRKYTVFVQRLILYLSLSAFFHAISFMMGGVHPLGPSCVFKGLWVSYFHWVVLLWDCTITINLYLNVVKMTSTKKFERVFCGICWGVPLAIAGIPLVAGRYGPAGAWCWIVDDWEWVRLFLWYIPLFLGIFFMLFAYIIIVYKLNMKASTWQGTYDPDTEQKKARMRKDITALRFYPVVYLLINTVPLINRIQNATNPDNPQFVLILGQCITAPLQGAMNALIFGADRTTLSQLTLSRVKLALQGKFRKRALIKEYVVEENVAQSADGPTNIDTTHNI